jgi:anti-anti-sigma factor
MNETCREIREGQNTIEIAIDDSHGSAVVLSVIGDVEGAGIRSLRDRAYESIEIGHERMIIDLTAVPTMEWTVLGMLIRLGTQLQNGRGRLAVVSGQSDIASMLSTPGVDYPFAVVATLEDGLNAIGNGAD